MAACGVCGIDEDRLSIRDALDALRTFPGRFRRSVDGLSDAELEVRPAPDVWSVLEYLVHTREVLDIIGMGLPLVLEQPGIAFPELDVDESAATRPDWVMERDLALGGIDQAVAVLLAEADGVTDEAWTRPFTIGTEAHDAGWNVRHAAHEGAHHLRDIERVRALVSRADD